MYLGKLVEVGKTSTLFTEPKHPYTEALMSAVALPDPELREKRKRIRLEGEIPSPRNPPSGCPFHPRCSYCTEQCITAVPALRANADSTHLVACHFPVRMEAFHSSE
jgi:peptide/nickel transport system ATP-binding protein